MRKTRAFDLIVVGGGIAGSAAALRAAQDHLEVLWIRGDRATAKRSRGMWVANIDNMIGIHDGVVRKRFVRFLRREHPEAAAALEAAPRQPIGSRDIIENTVERIRAEFSERVEILEERALRASRHSAPGEGPPRFSVEAGERCASAPYLVLATGVMDRQPSIRKTHRGDVVDDPKWIFPWANRELILYCIRCEGHLTGSSRAAVIGHSESAAHIAMMLQERFGSACCILSNGEAPQWSQESTTILQGYGIPVHRERLSDVFGDVEGLHGFRLENGEEILVQYALVALGLHRVYNDLARQLGADLADPEQPPELRHVRIDRRGETSIPGLFAVGDMAKRLDETVMKQIYTAQEYAVRAVDTIDARVRAARRAAFLAS